MNPDDPFEIEEYLNKTPRDEKSSILTREQVKLLIHDPYNVNSPVQLRQNFDEDVLDRIPIFRMLETYLEIIQREKYIELGRMGTLPPHFLVEIYDKRFITDPLIDAGLVEWRDEGSCISIMTVHMIAIDAELVNMTEDKLELSLKGMQLMHPEKRNDLFVLCFKTFTDEFPWFLFDKYVEKPVASFGWAYSILMLHQQGTNFLPVTFYSGQYLHSFPKMKKYFDAFRVPLLSATACYNTRTFDFFLHWFGLIILEKAGTNNYSDKDEIKRSQIFYEVFQFAEGLGEG